MADVEGAGNSIFVSQSNQATTLLPSREHLNIFFFLFGAFAPTTDIKMKGVVAVSARADDQGNLDHSSGGTRLQSTQDQVEHNDDDVSAHDFDDEPMVYITPRDYASFARERRAQLLSEGVDPKSIVFMSEIQNYLPSRAEDESPADYTKRYVDMMNSMIHRGVQILNDECTANVKPSGFGLADGRQFDLGPKSGATKREYRDFGEWWDCVTHTDNDGDDEEEETKQRQVDIPKRFQKFEIVPAMSNS